MVSERPMMMNLRLVKKPRVGSAAGHIPATCTAGRSPPVSCDTPLPRRLRRYQGNEDFLLESTYIIEELLSSECSEIGTGKSTEE